MMLLTKAIKRQLPKEPQGKDPMIWVKFFYPDFSWTWYAMSYDGEDSFYGLVDGHFVEIGYFSLSELLNNRGKWGMPIERDRSFRPCRLSELRAMLDR